MDLPFFSQSSEPLEWTTRWGCKQGRIQKFLWPVSEDGMKTEGEARSEGAKRPRIEGETRIEGAARDKNGGGVWGGGSVSPSPENFCKIDSEMVQSSAYLHKYFLLLQTNSYCYI